MYRKFSADYLFTGNNLLTDQFVLVTDQKGRIVAVVEEKEAGGDIERLKGILSPGFINTHCHLELSHMKGHIPQKTGLTDFILKVVFDRDSPTPEILAAIAAAESEMYQNGIVAVGDICNNSLTVAQKKQGRLRYRNFIETSGFPPAVAEGRFQRSIQCYEEFKKFQAENSIVPHAPYSVSEVLFDLINHFPRNEVLTIHNQETAAENELFTGGTGAFMEMFRQMNIDVSFFEPSGKSSLQTYLPLLSQYQSLILVHNVCVDEKDIRFEKLYREGLSRISGHDSATLISYCLCPNANRYISDTVPPVKLLLQEQCHIVLGTDSLASNHQLNILEEMKTLQREFPEISTTQLLQWATVNGARALQMEQALGSFEKGKMPGVVILEGLADQLLTKRATVRRLL